MVRCHFKGGGYVVWNEIRIKRAKNGVIVTVVDLKGDESCFVVEGSVSRVIEILEDVFQYSEHVNESKDVSGQ